jgi:osmotically-inducible protein OsmY
VTENLSVKTKRVLAPAALALGVALITAASVHAAERTDVDNSRINDRDAEAQKLTPLDQSNTTSDTDIVAKIRSSITDDKSLSINAKNVKVIVRGGAVTLRGPVDSATEKARVETIAKNVAGVTSVHNEIDTKH